jgi:hypothetical protein
MPDDIELARLAYTAIAAQAEGLDRTALAERLGVSDREAREAVELCAKLAAHPTVAGALPEVVGFDPMTRRYVRANSPEQADRIILYALSYLRSGLERVSAYAEARRQRWGEPEKPQAVQGVLLEVSQLTRNYRR